MSEGILALKMVIFSRHSGLIKVPSPKSANKTIDLNKNLIKYKYKVRGCASLYDKPFRARKFPVFLSQGCPLILKEFNLWESELVKLEAQRVIIRHLSHC